MYNNDYNAGMKQSLRQVKEKKANVFSASYEYSLAIEKCNRRLEKLKSEKSNLMIMHGQYPRLDPRSMMFPMRRPVVPNPMTYAYQFIPPKLYEPTIMPQMSQPFPVALEKMQTGMKLPQNNANTTETGFNYTELTALVNSLKGYNPTI